MNISAEARRIGISPQAMWQRLQRWPLEKALGDPPRPPPTQWVPRRPQRPRRPNEHTVTARARKAGMCPATVFARLRAGMSLRQALTKPSRGSCTECGRKGHYAPTCPWGDG